MSIAAETSGQARFESHGIEPIPIPDRDSTAMEQFWIWMGANMAPINWILGALGITLGLSVLQTLVVVVLGNLVGCAIFGLFAIMGFRTGVNTMAIARAAFGRRGGYLPSVLQIAMGLGWVGVNTWIVLDLSVGILEGLGVTDSNALRYVLALGIMVVQLGIAIYGYYAIRTFEKWTVPIAALVAVAMTVVAFTNSDVSFTGATAADGGATFTAMTQLMTAIGIGWTVSWWLFAADYSRYVDPATPERRVFWTTYLGMFIPTVWLAFLGAAIASGGAGTDPAALVTQAFGALALPVLFLVLHGPIATNIVNIFSASMGMKSLDVKPARWKLSALVGLVATGVLIAFVGSSSFASDFDFWMVSLVVLFTPLAGIMLTDFFILRKGKLDVSELFEAHDRSIYGDVNWAAMIAFAIGLLCGWLFQFGLVEAAQGPIATSLGNIDLSWLTGTLGAGLTYYGLMRFKARAAATSPAPASSV